MGAVSVLFGQRAVLIHVKVTIAGLVSLGTDGVQSFDQAAQCLEVLQAIHIFGADFVASGGHAPHYATLNRSAQPLIQSELPRLPGANLVPNRTGTGADCPAGQRVRRRRAIE